MEEINTDHIKPGFFKLRAKAHTQEEAGIPESLRAVPEKRTYNRNPSGNKRFADIDLRRSLVLKYIKDNPGAPMPLEVLSRAADYASPLGAHQVVKQLLESGRIRRHHLGNRIFTYTYVGAANTLPKGDARNGEVVVTKPGVAPVVAETKLETVETPVEQIKIPAKPSEEVFVENLDRFIWEFLKQLDVSDAQYQNTTLGEATQALRAFSIYMSNRAKETEHESKTDNQGS